MKLQKYIAREFYLARPFTFIERERTIKSIPKGYLLLRPIVAGICGSEVLYFKGQKEKKKLNDRLPMCLLHEGVAEVVDSGKRTNLKSGVKVVVNPMLPCGKCSSCKNLEENLCEFSKYMASTADGIARTYFLYPEDRVIPLPDGLESEVAAIVEPFSIALNAYEASGALKGKRMAVIGDGTIGYLIALTASLVGGFDPKELFLVGIIDEKLRLAQDFASTVNKISESYKIQNILGSFDVVFEAVGGSSHRATLEQAIDLLKPGGCCIILGISKGYVPIEVTRVVSKGLTFKGSTRSRMKHYIDALEILSNNSIRKKIKRIISKKKFSIKSTEDLTKAFRFADTEEGEARIKPGRVLVFFEQEDKT